MCVSVCVCVPVTEGPYYICVSETVSAAGNELLSDLEPFHMCSHSIINAIKKKSADKAKKNYR